MDEDDGQLARELVPVDEAFMMKESDQGSPAQLGLEQKGQNLEPTAKKKKRHIKHYRTVLYIMAFSISLDWLRPKGSV